MSDFPVFFGVRDCAGATGRGLRVALALLAGICPVVATASLPAETNDSLPDPVRTAIVRAGEEALKKGPFTIVHKPQLPPGGGPNDYLSIAPYWWPDPSKPDGLPYVRRDGEWNRANDADRQMLSAFVAAVRRLALAYRVTGDERYAEHAGELLRTWFLNPATRMNPHLRYAQAIPGLNEGRPAGIIDTWEFPDVIGSIGFLKNSPSWNAEDEVRLKAWFSDFLDWLLQSDSGRAEAAEKNNHGSWYIAQVTAYAVFSGRPETVRDLIDIRAPALLLAQIAENGVQPLEISRSRSLHYSQFNLTAWMDVAALAPAAGSRSLASDSPAAAGLHRAVLYLARHAPAAWPHPEKTPELQKLRPLFLRASAFFDDATLKTAADTLPPALDGRSLFELAEADLLAPTTSKNISP